jgi:hypothetical protein
MVQEAIVGIVVLGAAGFVVRRVITAIRPPAGRGACPSCESGSTACADAAAAAAQSLPPDVKPLVLIRQKPR